VTGQQAVIRRGNGDAFIVVFYETGEVEVSVGVKGGGWLPLEMVDPDATVETEQW